MNKNVINNLISVMERFPPSSHTVIDSFSELHTLCVHEHAHTFMCLTEILHLYLSVYVVIAMSANINNRKELCKRF